MEAVCITRQQEYEAFVAQMISDEQGHVTGQCDPMTAKMKKAFPELLRVPGFIVFMNPDGSRPFWGGTEHFWLQAPDGTIIDPSLGQFRQDRTPVYEPYDPKKHLTRKGTCMNCGGGLYTLKHVCSRECMLALCQDYGCDPSPTSVLYEADMDFQCDQDLIDKYEQVFPDLPGPH